MKVSRRAVRAVGCLAATGALIAGVAPVASAHSSSGHARFDNGKTITANNYIQSFTWTTCGHFQTSAVMNATPHYITNRTSFYQIGLGSLSVKGVSIGSSRQNSHTLKWTNNNGARGSYLSGSVCGGWGAVYVGSDVSASAFYYGNYRTASAHL